MRLLSAVAARRARGARVFGRLVEPGAEFTGQVDASADDAYEILSTGEVNITDTILQLGGLDGVTTPGATLTGLRFTGVTLEQAASVAYAHARFVSSNSNSKGCVLRFWAQLGATATFTTANGSISARPKTTSFFDWDVPPWSPNQDDANTLRDGLDPVVQEAVNDAAWDGNLVLLVGLSPNNTDAEHPRRRAHSFDSSSTLAPRVALNTTEEPPPEDPGGTGDFSDGFDLFGLEGNEAFNPSSPTLKDGTPITGDMLTYYNAALYWVQNTNAPSIVNIVDVFSDNDVYGIARRGQTIQESWLNVSRLTGDLRILDRLCDGHNALLSTFRADWGNEFTCSQLDGRPETCSVGGGDPWSPYTNKILSLGGGYSGTPWYHHTDILWQNQVKLWANVVQFAWALHVNRGKTSPAGHNYNALANTWGQVVEDFVDTWSGDDQTGWRQNYRGNGNHYTGGSRFRSGTGQYPVLSNDGSHSALSSLTQAYYLGRLADTGLWPGITNPTGAYEDADKVVRRFSDHLVPCTSQYGDGLVVKRVGMIAGGDDPRAVFATYTGYIASALIQSWLIGQWRTEEKGFTRDKMARVARQYARMHNGTTGITYKSMVGDSSDECGLNGSGGSARSVLQQVERGFASMLVLAPDDLTVLHTIATNAQNSSSGGGYSTPNYGTLPAAQFVREALVAVGDFE